jgi:hypothetical protein
MTDTAFGTRLAGRFKKDHKSFGNVYNGIGLVRDRDGNATGEYSYSGSVANRALELLGKELGMFVDRNQNVPMTMEQLRALPIFEQFLEQAATEAKRLGLDVDDEPPKGEPN